MNWRNFRRVRQFASQIDTEAHAGDGAGNAMTGGPMLYQGFVDEFSPMHAAGWVRSLSDQAERVEYEVLMPQTGEILMRGQAALFRTGLDAIGAADNLHGFYARLPRRLDQQECADAQVRVVSTGQVLERSAWLVSTYEPIQYLIMDLVDNCNLRCPFCLYDYSATRATNIMDEEIIEAAIRFAGHVTDGNFWFSCQHEPTLHPRLTDFVEKVPFEHRRKVFYTTNLAKRMPDAYFTALADSGIHHVNVSIESLDPTVYERMRKGARYRIFKENWDKLVPAFSNGKARPMLRYISMAYRSNLRQLPGMIDYLLSERGADQIEIRYTFDTVHLPRDFRHSEFLRRDDWLWLRDELARFPPEKVQLLLPPGLEIPAFDELILADPAPGSLPVHGRPHEAELPIGVSAESMPGVLPGRYVMRLFWDGRLEVLRHWGRTDAAPPGELHFMTVDIREIRDADAFLASLPI